MENVDLVEITAYSDEDAYYFGQSVPMMTSTSLLNR